MSRYEKFDCPVCQKKLDDAQPVVVCPDCGAPYHLDCYKATGHCIFPELHAERLDWKPPFVPPDETNEQGTESPPIKCNSCGTINPSTGLFCRTCGADLVSNQTMSNMGDGQNMMFNPMQQLYMPVPDEAELDGVTAKEVKIFVGRNNAYYLHHFKQLTDTTGKAKIMNWGGFLFMGWYYIFRKMYAIGIVAVIANFILSVPNTLLMLSRLDPSLKHLDNNTLTALYMICTLVGLVLRFFCGFYANSLYLSHAKKKIGKIKKGFNVVDGTVVHEVLTKKGGVALNLIVGILIGYSVLNVVMLFALNFI